MKTYHCIEYIFYVYYMIRNHTHAIKNTNYKILILHLKYIW